MNSANLGLKFIPINWVNWLKKYYPAFNPESFSRCLTEICEWRNLPAQKFQYIILGCGYFFEIKKPDPEKWLKEIKQGISGSIPWLGGSRQLVADLIVDEKAVKRRVKKAGLVVGPEERLLIARKSGPHPQVAPWIAALAVEIWIKRQIQEDLTWLVCNLYESLSGRKINAETFSRKRKEAERVTIKIYLPDERDVPVIERLVDRFEGRYKRLMKDEMEYQERYEKYKNEGIVINHPFEKLAQEQILQQLYSFSDDFDKMLKAVGVDLPEYPEPPEFFF